jgi:cellulose synthase/poly-beta-1,6-N-acetylglucosamine synthase-like glycosyltransferase
MSVFGGTESFSGGLEKFKSLVLLDHEDKQSEVNRGPTEAGSKGSWAATVSRLVRFGVSPIDITNCRRAAHRHGSTLTRELIANGLLNETAYYEALAVELGLRFVKTLDCNSLVLLPGHTLPPLRTAATVKTLLPSGETVLLIAPDDRQLAVLEESLRRSPELRRSVCLTTPAELDRALIQRLTEGNLEKVVFGLKNLMPSFSAFQVTTGTQGIVLGIVLTMLPYCAWYWPWETLLSFHVLATLVFAACVFMRGRAAVRLSPQSIGQLPPADGPYPIYTVITAVYREASVVPQLVSQLMALNWPASRIEILIACEESDTSTIEALRREIDPSRIQIIVAPKMGPQTKPRALSLALQAARGEFVVIYDAEDRPHPDQLMEAYQRFQREPATTACLQAPLIVTNRADGFLARMFSFEYAALFGGLLPDLCRTGRFIPLGGTSNHFRRSTLMQAGGWDPFNVTEDADLGTRLCRLGYRSGMITKPTSEDAPTSFHQWRPQRVRWFKGWLQTWLVHTRNPKSLLDDLGPRDFARFHLLTMGMFLSALIYPSVLVVAVWGLYIALSNSILSMTSLAMSLFAIDFCNIILGHFVFSELGTRVERSRGIRTSRFLVLGLPAYWTLLSIAAWGALWELVRKPHHWNKTEHFPTAARDVA